MMYDIPMLADFGVRLSFGLTILLLVTNWQDVPLPFFRTQCQVILGLLVLAALDGSRSAGLGPTVWILIAGAALAYMATIAWGLGLPRVAVPVTFMVALATAGWLALASHSDSPMVWAFNTASRTASGFLLGATLGAMLLGHHYLTAPAMSIDPLKRFVRCMGWALAIRGLIAMIGVSLAHSGIPGLERSAIESVPTLFLIMRWGMGFAGPVLATILAWKTVQIRSTQSATGILYAAMALVLFGELTSLIGARAGGLIG
jgi:hypothetical protein